MSIWIIHRTFPLSMLDTRARMEVRGSGIKGPFGMLMARPAFSEPRFKPMKPSIAGTEVGVIGLGLSCATAFCETLMGTWVGISFVLSILAAENALSLVS